MNRLPITKRELEILTLISRGLNASLIGQKLFISRHTVRDHTKNLKVKLKAKNVAHLVKLGFTNGLIPLAA